MKRRYGKYLLLKEPVKSEDGIIGMMMMLVEWYGMEKTGHISQILVVQWASLTHLTSFKVISQEK